jgi:hypothetical protein
VFDGAGVATGEAFGARTTPPLVGYECDGAPIDRIDEATGIAVLSEDATLFGTPPGFCPLAVGVLDGDWQELPPRETHAARAGVRAATMGLYSHNGTVFTAGTTDWAQVLATDEEPRVARITQNVIDRLLGRASPGR